MAERADADAHCRGGQLTKELADMTPRVLLVSLTNDIGTERIAAALCDHGAQCAVLSPHGFFATATRHSSLHFPLPAQRGMWLSSLFARSGLEKAVRRWVPDIVVPLDDVAAWLLRGLVTSDKASQSVQRLIVRSLGSPEGYQACANRLELMQAAAALGINIPEFSEVHTAAAACKAADRWGYPVVMKSEFTCGGRGVAIAANDAELASRFDEAAYWRGGVARRARSATKSAIWHHAGLPRTYGLPPILQTYVAGRPAMRTVCAWNGRVIEGASFVAERTNPEPTGTSTLVRHIEHEEMAAAAALLTAKLGCSGFVSFDFILDNNNRSFLIEMNARCIGTTHLGGMFGHDLCGALVAVLRGAPAWTPRPAAPDGRMVALFPRELERDPVNLDALRSATIFRDVPVQDPSLIAAYLERYALVHPDHVGSIRELLGVPAADGLSSADDVSRKRPGRWPSAERRSHPSPLSDRADVVSANDAFPN